MKKTIGKILLVILIAVAAALLWNYHLTKILWHNFFPERLKMDTSTDWSGGESYEKLPYCDISEADYLDLYVPDHEEGEKLPLMVLVHGGGFVTNDSQSRQAQLMYRYFRDHGYACASINYRLAQEAPFPAAIEDVKCAVRFLRANADSYGYDPEKIVMWGESAGGYICTMASVTTDDEFNDLPFIGQEEGQEVSARVSAFLDFYGASALGDEQAEFDKLGIPAWIRDLSMGWVNKHLKGSEYKNIREYWLRRDLSSLSPEEKQEFNPYYYIEKNFDRDSSLHALFWYGGADITVPFTFGEQLAYLMMGTLGSDKVFYKYFPDYMHATDAYFNDENLGSIEEWLNGIL